MHSQHYHCQLIYVFSDQGNVTVCPVTLNETELKADDCLTLEVYAEQYGVQSEKKVYNVCYYGKIQTNQIYKLCTYVEQLRSLKRCNLLLLC